MKKQLPFGLVVEGNLIQSVILRSPSLRNEIGPIKAKTIRLARRASNFLRAGSAAQNIEALQATRLILVHVPDAALGAVLDEIRQLDVRDKAVILCETWQPSDRLRDLAARGAAIASCVVIPTPASKWIVFEGDPAAIRPVRKLLDRDYLRTLEVKRGMKTRLFEAEQLAGVQGKSLLLKAEAALRKASLSGKQLHALLEGLNQRMFQDAMRSRSALRVSATLEVDEQAVPLEVEGA